MPALDEEELDLETAAAKREEQRLARWQKVFRPSFKYGPFVVLTSIHIQYDKDTGLEKQYTRDSGPFMSNVDLLQKNAPGMSPKFALHGISSQQQDQRFVKRPDESAQEFAVRMSKLAAEETNTKGLFQDTNPVVPPTGTVGPHTDGLEQLNVIQLKTKAKVDAIELGHAQRKEDILGIMRAAYAARKEE